MKARILVAEDDQDLREMLIEVLEDAGYGTLAAADGRQALDYLADEKQAIDLVITDVQMPGIRGDALLNFAREKRAEALVVVITAFGSVEQAVELVRAGAYQYLKKPFANSALISTVEEALRLTEAQRAQARLRRESHAPRHIIGVSRQMRELYEQISVAARSTGTVLITGESGTGKELVAREIHKASARTGAFVAVNCAAIPSELLESELFGHTGQAFTGARQQRAGLIEAAHKGTLFLDEVGDLPLPVQPKLLRALQEGRIRPVGSNIEREVQFRVVAATNRNLEDDMHTGRFREDLYWRLNVIQLYVPPLRERAYDIPLLVDYFITETCEKAGRRPLDVSPDTLAVLTAYSWPGNVRELENAIERAVAFARGSVLSIDDLPERIRVGGKAASLVARSSEQSLSLREMERDYILEILRRTEGNKTRAAEILGLDRKTLYRKLEEYKAEEQVHS